MEFVKNEKSSQIPHFLVYIGRFSVYNNLVRKPPQNMNNNSERFLNELAALLKEYNASVHATCDGELEVYVGDEVVKDLVSLETESIVDFLVFQQ